MALTQQVFPFFGLINPARGDQSNWDEDFDYNLQTIDRMLLSGTLGVYGSSWSIGLGGPNADRSLYYYAGGSPTGAYLKYSNTNNLFELSHSLRLLGNYLYFLTANYFLRLNSGLNRFESPQGFLAQGNIWTSGDFYAGAGDLDISGDIYLGFAGPEQTRNIYFYDGGSPTGTYLRFREDGLNRFEFNKTVYGDADCVFSNANFVNGDPALILRHSGYDTAKIQFLSAGKVANLNYDNADAVGARFEFDKKIDAPGISISGDLMIPDNPQYSMLIEEDFFHASIATGSIGSYGWSIASIGAAPTVAGQAPEAGKHNGIISIQTSSTVSQGGTLYLPNASGNASILPEKGLYVFFNWRCIDDRSRIAIGIDDSPTAFIPTNGIYLDISNDSVAGGFTILRCYNGGSLSSSSDFGDLSGTSWHYGYFRYGFDGKIYVSVDGSAELSVSTNIPTAALSPSIKVINNSSGATRRVNFDYYTLRVYSGTKR